VIRPDEALLIFKKWRDEKTVVFCISRLFSCWAVTLRGRIASIEREDDVRMDSLDGSATLGLTLSGAEAFEYAEPGEPLRSLVPPEARQTSFLLVALPLRVAQPFIRRDKLAFVALPEGKAG
jgi:hypothetical protein